MAISKDEIWDAANRIELEGGSPTLAAVRRLLGGGSFTTISEAMREWHQRKKEAQETTSDSCPVPPDLDDAIRGFSQAVWAKAVDLAKSEAEKLAAEYDQAKKEWERERQDLEALAEDLSTALEESQAKDAETRAAFDELVRLHSEKETAIVSLKGQLAQSEARIDELRQENQRLHELLRHMVPEKQ